MTDEVMPEGKRVIERWLHNKERVARLQKELNAARSDESISEADVAKWLLPPDAKPGEKIAVWFGDSLIQAEVGGVYSEEDGSMGARAVTRTTVTIRLRGPKL